MILLIPLSRFQVFFERACGRPYSKLESLMLRAIGQGAGTLKELRETFEIHQRLLIEALVTLTQAGWLAVSGAAGKSFTLTPEGHQALLAGDTPTSLQTWEDDTHILMERLTGSVVLSADVQYVRNGDPGVDWKNSVQLAPQIVDDVDESRVDCLLPRSQGEWIRSIESIELRARDFQWLPVTVNPETGKVGELPDAWRHLQDTLVDEARRRADTLPASANTSYWEERQPRRSSYSEDRNVLPGRWSVQLSPQDFLYNHTDHVGYLREVLDCAGSTVFIASAFVSRARLEAIREPLFGALTRGVIVDLLWGYETEDRVVNELHNWAKAAEHERLSGKLRFNRRPSGSHAKVILWDRAENQFEGCIGSCNWLSFASSETGGETVTEVSVKLSRPGLLAQLSRCAGSLYKELKDDLGSSLYRRQTEAGEMERLEATGLHPGTANAQVNLIQDQGHERSLREWSRDAQHRFLVTSDRLGAVAATRLAGVGRSRTDHFSWAALYGRTELHPADLSPLTESVTKAGGALTNLSRLHAKVVVSDDVACVSSYNFLSADPFQKASAARELGIVITGSEPVGWLSHRLFPKTNS